jgi:hypothetical protein
MSDIRTRTAEAKGKKPSEALPVVKVMVNGEPVVVNAATFTGRERQLMKKELAGLGYEADGEDAMYAAIWVVMRRNDPTLSMGDVLDSVTSGDFADAETVGEDADDSPEA